MVYAKKSLGQNFLKDQLVIEQIINAINPLPEQNFLEIGPGRGALTKKLMANLTQLTAIEKDHVLCDILTEKATNWGNLILHNDDALKLNLTELFPQQKVRIVGNLPYNISSPLIFHLLGQANQIEDMHFMLQREVVQRIAAKPGNKQYGRISVMVQAYSTPSYLFDVPPTAFSPAPKVFSSIISIEPKPDALKYIVDAELLSLVVKTAFNQRRKTLRKALKAIIDSQLLVENNIDPMSRAEDLSVDDYLKICNVIHGLNN